MNSSDFIDQLQEFAGTLQKVHITRLPTSNPTANGFVLAVYEPWFLLWQFHDFYPDGFTVMHVDDIERIRHGPYEDYWLKMLQTEGIVQSLPEANFLIDDLHSMLKQLKAKPANCVIECEGYEGEDSNFYIGRVVDVEADLCRFAYFDTLGRWDDELHEIPFDQITRLEFDTPYIDIFSRHLEGPCPFEADS